MGGPTSSYAATAIVGARKPLHRAPRWFQQGGDTIEGGSGLYFAVNFQSRNCPLLRDEKLASVYQFILLSDLGPCPTGHDCLSTVTVRLHSCAVSFICGLFNGAVKSSCCVMSRNSLNNEFRLCGRKPSWPSLSCCIGI